MATAQTVIADLLREHQADPHHEDLCSTCRVAQALVADPNAEVCDVCAVPLSEDFFCPKCGVIHMDPCPECGRSGYHRDDCGSIG